MIGLLRLGLRLALLALFGAALLVVLVAGLLAGVAWTLLRALDPADNAARS